jgi:catechol 2,3-dioxygenase-like lactoylglutathione lyase family enzyme
MTNTAETAGSTEEKMMLKRLDNVDIICQSLDAMVPFYRDVLSLPLAHPYVEDQGWAGFQSGDVTLYLIAAASGESAEVAASTPAIGQRPGLESLAFEVDDLGEAIRWLSARGVVWATDVIESPWYRYRGFRDPEGNLLYVTRPAR